MNLSLFLGRLHPLLVHLPIGFLILAALFYYLGRKEKYSFLQRALPFSLAMTSISALLSIIFGWLLASEGGYNASTLLWHRWLGIVLAAGALVLWRYSQSNQKFLSWALIPMLLLLTLTGHLGAELTHGSGYLTAYGPKWMRSAYNSNQGSAQFANLPAQVDSIQFYQHIIKPVLDKKCVDCHNEDKQKGKLNLSSEEGIRNGGESGQTIVKGAPMQSELIRRVTLSANDRKFMPPKGEVLTYQEIKLLDYWISNGPSFELSISDESIPEDILILLENSFGISKQNKSYIEKIQIAPPAEAKVQALAEKGFYANTIAEDVSFIAVKAKASLEINQLKELQALDQYIAWLDLSDLNLKDSDLKILSSLPNLTRLNLSKNNLSDEALVYIQDASHLESLNLYQTDISDAGLAQLSNLKSLSKIYLWKTKVTEKGKEELQQKLPYLSIE